jgi:hypothetical protein
MIRARWGGAALLGVGVAAALTLGPSAPAQPSGNAEELLRAASTANEHQSYAGALAVEWRVHGQLHQVETFTHVADGTVEVGGGDQRALSRDGQRFVGSPGNWSLLLGPDVPARAAPSADAHWDLSTGRGPTVAGRATVAVSAADPDTGAVRARFFIDPATGTLLRRDVLGADGRLLRRVAFETVVPLGSDGGAAAPSRAKPAEPGVVAKVPSRYRAPRVVGRGFVLLGQYTRQDGTIELDYGDGMFTLSLFEERGTVDWGSLPAGTSSEVGGVAARAYETPTTSVVVWGAKGLVVTCVSDAPADQLALAARDVVGGVPGSSVVHDVAHFVLGPFGWD